MGPWRSLGGCLVCQAFLRGQALPFLRGQALPFLLWQARDAARHEREQRLDEARRARRQRQVSSADFFTTKLSRDELQV